MRLPTPSPASERASQLPRPTHAQDCDAAHADPVSHVRGGSGPPCFWIERAFHQESIPSVAQWLGPLVVVFAVEEEALAFEHVQQLKDVILLESLTLQIGKQLRSGGLPINGLDERSAANRRMK